MSQTNGRMQLELSSDLAERTIGLKKDDQTPREIMEQVYRLGLYQLEYRQGASAQAARKAYREKKAAEDKLGRELLKKAQRDPELAVKLGLGTRVAL